MSELNRNGIVHPPEIDISAAGMPETACRLISWTQTQKQEMVTKLCAYGLALCWESLECYDMVAMSLAHLSGCLPNCCTGRSGCSLNDQVAVEQGDGDELKAL